MTQFDPSDPYIAQFLSDLATRSDLSPYLASTPTFAPSIQVIGSPSPASGVHTAASFSAAAFQSSNSLRFDPATPTLVTVQEDGIYLVTFNVTWTTNTTGNREVTVSRNAVIVCGETCPSVPGGASPYQSMSAVELCAPGDVFTVDLFQNSGGALSCSYRLAVARLGATGDKP